MNGKLEPCPDCGDQPKISINKERGRDTFQILCANCYEVTTEAAGILFHGDSIADVINEWNDFAV